MNNKRTSKFLVTTTCLEGYEKTRFFQDKNFVRFLEPDDTSNISVMFSRPEQSSAFIRGMEYIIRELGGEVLHHTEEITVDE